MDADTRMACSLVLSLVVSAANFLRAAAGEADILDVGVRYVVAFLLAFIAVGIVGRVLREYVTAAEDRHRDDADEAGVEGDGSAEGLRLAEE